MSVITNPVSDMDQATSMMEEARRVVESSYLQLLHEELDSDALFSMRIALQDACDTIGLATRHIERVQRTVEAAEEAAESTQD